MSSLETHEAHDNDIRVPPADAAPGPAGLPSCDQQKHCPMVQLLDTLAGKWSFPILYRLIVFDAPVRFGELQRSIGRITQKELTKHLREFEALGLVTRTVFAEVPPRVEYRITPYGKTLERPLSELARWSQTFGEALFGARRQRTGETVSPG